MQFCYNDIRRNDRERFQQNKMIPKKTSKSRASELTISEYAFADDMATTGQFVWNEALKEANQKSIHACVEDTGDYLGDQDEN